MAVYIGDKNITEVLAGNALDSAKQYADQGDANTLQQAKEYTDSEVSQFEADYKQADATVLSEAKQYADQNMIPKSQKGQPGGLAELDSTGRVPAGQLPGFVDDVINVDTYNDLPNPGEDSKIYITIDTNLQYRWGGESYVILSPSLALGTTSETAGRGDWTQAAYNHSLITNGSNPHKTTFSSLPDKPTSLPANGGNAESAVKDGDGNNISTSYFNINRGTVTDLNDADDIGMWSFTTGAQNVPEEITTSGIVFTYYSTAAIANLIQMCTGYKNGVPTSWYVRNRTSYTKWSPWRKIWDSGNLKKLSQLQDDVVAGNYFKLSANKVTNLNDVPINTFFVSTLNPQNAPDISSSSIYVSGYCIAANNDPKFRKQFVYADGWYGRTEGNGSWGGWNKFWHSGNFNPSDYISFNNTTEYTPTGQYNPATKGYVDSLVGTYILDMDNILAYISSSGSTPISQSNSQILQSIQSSVLDGNMPRAFGKYTVQNNEDPAYPANSSISWQLTDTATIDETPGAVYMSFTCLAGGSSGPKVRTLAIIVLADGQVMSSGDSGWWSAGGSSGGLVIPASGEQAATGWTYNGKQVYVQRFTGSMGGSGNTMQYANISIPNLSFLVLKSGTISYSNFNYEIGEVQFASDGTNAIVSQIRPTYGTNGNVSLRIYDLNQNSGWTYELWLAYTK